MHCGRGAARRPRRYSVLRPLGALVVFAAVGLMTVSGPWLAQSRPLPGAPDVVIFLTDDQRWDSLGGMTTVQAELVAKGRLFENAMVPTSLCCPSRATILTGDYAHTTGVWGNRYPKGGWRRVREEGIEDDTIATALDERGYETALVGKYFNGFSRSTPGYVPPGWDHFLAFRTPGRSGSYYNYRLSGSSRFYGNRSYSTDVLARKADRLVRSTPSDTPLLLYIATYAPHGPFAPPRRYATPSGTQADATGLVEVRDRRHSQPSWLQAQQPQRAAAMEAIRDGQDRSLLAVDDAVDRVIRALRESGRLHNTLFLFMSDNGLLRGEHGLTGKHVPYDAATRVPMVLRWDAQVPAGTVDRRLALNVDVAATLSAATGIRIRTEGLDLLGSQTRPGFPVEAIGRRNLDRPAYCGWRTARYLYVRYADREEELYDYAVDPAEEVNRADDRRYVRTLRALRRNAREGCSPTPPGFSWTGSRGVTEPVVGLPG
jgi:N-acetylglucosamine-6-sulfatase